MHVHVCVCVCVCYTYMYICVSICICTHTRTHSSDGDIKFGTIMNIAQGREGNVYQVLVDASCDTHAMYPPPHMTCMYDHPRMPCMYPPPHMTYYQVVDGNGA